MITILWRSRCTLHFSRFLELASNPRPSYFTSEACGFLEHRVVGGLAAPPAHPRGCQDHPPTPALDLHWRPCLQPSADSTLLLWLPVCPPRPSKPSATLCQPAKAPRSKAAFRVCFPHWVPSQSWPVEALQIFFFFKCHPAFKIPSESIGLKHPVYHSQTWKLWLTVYPRH